MTASALRPWRGPFEPVWWAARALAREILGFRFDYPIEVVPGAGPAESPRYYLYSDRLFFDAMDLDRDGVPIQRSRTFGETYNPAYVAWYGLASLEQFHRGLDPAGLEAFQRQVAWLAAYAVRRADGAVVWPYTFDWLEGRCHLKAPWISAMAQGLAVSALVRGHRLTRQGDLLDLCRAATVVFRKSVEDGGVRGFEGGGALYEEYPGHPAPRVLDGFLFSLLGLYDLAIETGDTEPLRLFEDGIRGLTRALPSWDYRHKWSWYGAHGYLCPPHYHRLNRGLLAILARLTGDPVIARYAGMWDVTRLGLLDRLEIFLVFLATKNWARFRLRRR